MKKLIGALVAFVSAALMQGLGIEITEAVQAEIVNGLVALVGLVLIVAEAIRRRRGGPVDREGGFAVLALLRLTAGACILLLAIGGAMGLSGCVTSPPPAENLIEAASKAIEDMAEEVGTAQQLGQITVEREAELLDLLEAANENLRGALAVTAAGADYTTTLEEVRRQLARVRLELARDAQP